MSGPVSSWMVALGLCVAAVAQCAVVAVMAQASRPIEEMRGGCDDYALDVRRELAALEGIPRKLSALTGRGPSPPMSPIGQSLRVTLHHTDQVTLAATPKRSGSYAGLLAFSVPTDGHYRIGAGSAVWIEVVHDQERVEATEFEMQTGCPTLFKTIRYRLKAGVNYWLELSENTSTATILLSPETR